MKKLKGKLPYIFLVFLCLVLVAVIVIPDSLIYAVDTFTCKSGKCTCICNPDLCYSCCADADSCDCFCWDDDPSYHCPRQGGGGGGTPPPIWY